jgi:pullulanase
VAAGSVADPVVVVANFSDYTTPNALAAGAEYAVPNWPATPAGRRWFEVTQARNVPAARHDRESIFAWEAKVYRLAPG